MCLLIRKSVETLLHSWIPKVSRRQPLIYSCHYRSKSTSPILNFAKFNKTKIVKRNYNTKQYIKISSHQLDNTYCVIFLLFRMHKNTTIPNFPIPYLLKDPSFIPDYSPANLNYANFSDSLQIPFRSNFSHIF